MLLLLFSSCCSCLTGIYSLHWWFSTDEGPPELIVVIVDFACQHLLFFKGKHQALLRNLGISPTTTLATCAGTSLSHMIASLTLQDLPNIASLWATLFASRLQVAPTCFHIAAREPGT
jgi:hypothetical protein